MYYNTCVALLQCMRTMFNLWLNLIIDSGLTLRASFHIHTECPVKKPSWFLVHNFPPNSAWNTFSVTFKRRSLNACCAKIRNYLNKFMLLIAAQNWKVLKTSKRNWLLSSWKGCSFENSDPNKLLKVFFCSQNLFSCFTTK